MTNYLRKAIFGAGIVFAFSIFAAFFGYLFRLVLARNLTVEEYGLFYAIYALISLLWIFKGLGLHQAVVKYIPEFRLKKRYDLIKNSLISTFILQIIFSGILSLILITFSDYLALNYFNHPSASIVIKLLAMYILFKPLVFFCMSAFQGFQNMRYYASVDLMRSIIVLVIVFIGFNLSKNVLVPGFAYMISPIILAFIFIPILLKKTFPQFSKLKFSVDKVLIKKLFKFGLPVMIGGASWLVMTYTDTIMLTYFSGIKQVGLYNAALPTASLLHYFSLALATVLLPMSSELWSRGHKEQLRAGINLLYKYSFLIIIPFALIMVSFPEILLRMLFGNEYVPAATTLKILSIGTIFLIIARVNFSILSGIGKPKINAKIMWGVAVLNIMLNLMLIPFYGIIGAAIATSTSFLVMLILSTIYMERNIAIKIPLWLWLKILVIGISFVWFIAYLKKALVMAPLLEASLVIPIAALFYVSLSFIFRVVSFTEIKELINGLRL